LQKITATESTCSVPAIFYETTPLAFCLFDFESVGEFAIYAKCVSSTRHAF